jgi:hypothetical protein
MRGNEKMLYRKNSQTTLSEDLFCNPSSEYRGAPFWAWNCKVSREDVDRILDDLKKMGMGGSHLHCRTGMSIPYLSEEFMEVIRYAHQKGNEQGLMTWLYDEDRFPSGAAGGLVTKDWTCRQRYLNFSPKPLEENDRRMLLGRYAIALERGFLKNYKKLDLQEKLPEGFCEWFLYREIAEDNPWFNNQAYVDTLNPQTIRKFVEVTYEAYQKVLGEAFGETVPGFFTDEPQFMQKKMLGYSEEKKQVFLPFTDDFCDSYQKKYQLDFLGSFPECIWELPDKQVSIARYQYHNHICNRFVQAFANQIGAWCEEHHIALTGHLMSEPTLTSQTSFVGEAMRSYPAFQIPGIDMLYDSRELNTAKQAQSVVHQYGKEGMLSELYGVTGWEFDFRGHKLAGDWQAALGVTVRVHHLNWTSMAGEAKRDYPASIGSQSPWYLEYSLIENYFSRLNTALTRGISEVKVGVIHPIESFWLYWGTREQTHEIQDEMEQEFENLTKWLLFGLIDFDFISEALWVEETPDHYLTDSSDFVIGKMKYDTILVPNCVTLRRSTLDRLRVFQRKGVRVIFAGCVPGLVDVHPDNAVKKFSENCEIVTFSKKSILDALSKERCVEIHNEQGIRTSNILYQMRQDGERKWLFLAHCYKMQNPDLPRGEKLKIEVKGIYRPVLYDAMTGDIRDVSYCHKEGYTVIFVTVYDHDSLLYALDPAMKSYEIQEDLGKSMEKQWKYNVEIPDLAELFLEEKNVLVLDMAEAKMDENPWEEKEEILRIDNKFRKRIGYPQRMEAFPQPWVIEQKEEEIHRVTLRYVIESEIEIENVELGLEQADQIKLILNGQMVSSDICGYYVDHSIQKVKLPKLQIGSNVLIAEMPFYHQFNLEAMFLLGDFGVKVVGKSARLTAPVKKLAFGDICNQGLPFYGGNLTYRIKLKTDQEGDLRIEATQFRCPLIKVALDGIDCGRIAFSPYAVIKKNVSAGEHILELTAFGNRHNTFGALHNCNHTFAWKGHPNSYRTVGEEWAYEYQLHPQGILKSPVITCLKE